MSPPDLPVITLYTRAGCHLCEDAAAILARLGSEYHFALAEVDITSQPDLEHRYGLAIPVVRFQDGQELAAPIDEAALRAALERQCRG